MQKTKQTDPYAPPPMHHDRSGAVLRVAILAGLLGAAGLGYAWMADQPRTALVPEAVQEQQVADAGYQVAPEALPDATSESPAPAATPAAPARRTAPPQRAPEPTPEPEAAPAVTPLPTEPTPIPPMDTPPAGTVGF